MTSLSRNYQNGSLSPLSPLSPTNNMLQPHSGIVFIMSHVHHYSASLSAPFSQTKAIFDSNNTAPHTYTRYRAPTWSTSTSTSTSTTPTKRYSPHRRSSEDQVSPRHSPRQVPTDDLSPLPPSLQLHESSPQDTPRGSYVEQPTQKLGTYTVNMPDVAVTAATPRYLEQVTRPLSDGTYQAKVGRERGNSASRERTSGRIDGGLKGINDTKDPSRRNSDSDSASKYLPGYWWMTLEAAEQDGIVTNAQQIVSHCRFGNARVLAMTSGIETVSPTSDITTTYTVTGSWTALPISLISAVGSVLMVLRGANLASEYAPSTGVRFDGFYKVLQFGNIMDDPDAEIYSVTVALQRILGQTPYEELKKVPRQSQIDDWILYDRLESMSDSSGRSRGDLMHELSRESSRRQSAASVESVPTGPIAQSSQLPPPQMPPMPITAPPAIPSSQGSLPATPGPLPIPPKDVVGRKMPAVIHEDPVGEEEEERGSRGSSGSGIY